MSKIEIERAETWITFKFAERLLLDISTHVRISFERFVRTLQINQEANFWLSNNYFLGLCNVEWAPIILEMFLRKLDKLQINNSAHIDYLTRESAKMLEEVRRCSVSEQIISTLFMYRANHWMQFTKLICQNTKFSSKYPTLGRRFGSMLRTEA